MEGNKLLAVREPLFPVHPAQLTREFRGGLGANMALCTFAMLQWSRNSKNALANAALKTSLPMERLLKCPWDAGRAAQSHHPGTGQEKMNRDETKQRPERKWKEVGGQNLNQVGC